MGDCDLPLVRFRDTAHVTDRLVAGDFGLFVWLGLVENRSFVAVLCERTIFRFGSRLLLAENLPLLWHGEASLRRKSLLEVSHLIHAGLSLFYHG